MNDEIHKDLLQHALKEHEEGADISKNQKLTKMIDIFLIVFVILTICALAFPSL